MKTLLKRLLLHPQRTLDLEYQHGGDELQDLIMNASSSIKQMVMAKGDGREVGFHDGGCFLKFLKREQINNQTFIAFLNWV